MKKSIYAFITLSILIFVYIVEGFFNKNLPILSYGDSLNNCYESSNLVVTANFTDSGLLDSSYFDVLENTYNTSLQSVKNYFLTASNQNYTIDSTILKDFVGLNYSKACFMPKYYYSVLDGSYKEVNSQGYDNRYFDEDNNPCADSVVGAKQHIDRFVCEQRLIREVLYIAKNYFDGVNCDRDNDGICDNITVVINCDDNLDWNDILWSHRSSLSTLNLDYLKSTYYVPDDDYEINQLWFIPVSVGGKTVIDYTLFTTKGLKGNITDVKGEAIYRVGTICHEMMHGLGLYDYYSYNSTTDNLYVAPVGELDIMGGGDILPNMPLTYTRLKLNWIKEDSIMPVEKGGSYTLYPTTHTNNTVKALKIVTNDYADKHEYFMIEAREAGGDVADCLLTGSGIIIYRINEQNGYIGYDGKPSSVNYSNMYGESEVYVLRLLDGNLYDEKAKTSFAILDGNTKVYNYEGKTYVDKSTIGISDKSAYKTVIDQNNDGFTITAITYSDNENSGIVIKNINKRLDGGYSFDLSFEDDSFYNEVEASLSKYYNNRDTVVNWTGLRSGNVEIYLYPAKTITKYKNGKYVSSKKIDAKMLESGNMFGNDCLSVTKVPASYCRGFIDGSYPMSAVYMVYENKDGQKTALYVGTINPENPTFIEYLFGTTTWLVTIITIVGVFSVVIVVGVILMFKKEKTAKANNKEDSLEQLEQEFGEKYWLNDDTKE